LGKAVCHVDYSSSLSEPDRSGLTSRSLIARLKSRDPDAWERLIKLYGPLIYHWGRKAGLSGEDAADLLQEVSQSVWRAIGGFRRDRAADSFRGWLWTITRNKVMDHFRACSLEPAARGGTAAQLRMEQVDSPGPPSTTVYLAGKGEPVNLVQRALAAIKDDFSARVWKAFVMTTLQDCNPAQASDELGMTPNAVRQAKFRVLRRLREELGELE
jgi:RNA polymerase sigma-70 factor (ECF subfamily)